MDKSWINLPNRLDPRFLNGLMDFIKFAYMNKQHGSEIKCPCRHCRFSLNQRKKTVGEHIVMHSFPESYTTWDRHGETLNSQVRGVNHSTTQPVIEDDMEGLICDNFGHHHLTGGPIEEESFDGPDEQTRNVFTLLENARSELYPDSTTTQDIHQGAIVQQLREELRGELRRELREEVREEVRREECDKLRQELRVEMELMMQQMLKSRFDSVPSVNTQVPDASSAHRLASNNGIGSEQLQWNKLHKTANSCDRSHEINQHIMKKKQNIIEHTQEKMNKKKQINDETWKKLINQAKKKKKKKPNDDVNNYGEILVNLLDYKGPKQVVARGILISSDPTKEVGGVQLGNEFWEVIVKEATKPGENLSRPFEGVNKLGEAIGKSVAWRNMDV
ncbi:hypothetical protein OROHE_018182 [Orobanche hederae]